MLARSIAQPASTDTGHTIVVNGVERPRKPKLELTGDGVTAEETTDSNRITISIPAEISGGDF